VVNFRSRPARMFSQVLVSPSLSGLFSISSSTWCRCLAKCRLSLPMISCVRTNRCGWHSGLAACCALEDGSSAAVPPTGSPSYSEMAILSEVGAAARKSSVVPVLPQAASAAAARREEKTGVTFIRVASRQRPAARQPGVEAGERFAMLEGVIYEPEGTWVDYGDDLAGSV